MSDLLIDGAQFRRGRKEREDPQHHHRVGRVDSAVAGIYTAYAMVMLWIFPLFPATPKLGPVYQKIAHFVPMEFPLLIIVPALFLDVLRPKMAVWKKWTQAAAAGAIFLL